MGKRTLFGERKRVGRAAFWACLAALPLVSTLIAGCGDIPDYGDVPFQCGTAGECPDGYRCRQRKVCVRDGYDGPIPGVDAGAGQNPIPGSDNTSGNTPVGGNPNTGGAIGGPGGVVNQSPGAGVPSQGSGWVGNPSTTPSPSDGAWGNPCFSNVDCSLSQKCAFYYNRCCDPTLNSNCI